MKLKIIIVAYYKSYPPESGAASVTFNLSKHLAGNRTLIQLNPRAKPHRFDEEFDIINEWGFPHNKILKVIGIFFRLPFLVNRIRDLNARVVIIEGAAWSCYNIALFFCIMAFLPSVRIVYHAHNVEYFLRKKKDNAVIAILSRWAEGFLIKKSSLSFAVSRVDAQAFEKLYGTKPRILPNGIDLAMINGISRQRVSEIRVKYGLRSPVVLFMGLIGFKPNNEALNFLNSEVFPKLHAHSPNIKLAIIGGKVPSTAPWMINPGSIPYEDVGPFLMACDLCVAPIFSGSGTRLKILEYLGARRPVVSTSKGAEGLQLRDGYDLVIAQTADEFVKAILHLIENPEIASRLGRQGYDTVARLFSWPSIIHELNSELLRLL